MFTPYILLYPHPVSCFSLQLQSHLLTTLQLCISYTMCIGLICNYRNMPHNTCVLSFQFSSSILYVLTHFYSSYSLCTNYNLRCHFVSANTCHIQHALAGHTCKYAASYTHTNHIHNLHPIMPGWTSGGMSALAIITRNNPNEYRYLPSYSNLTSTYYLLIIYLPTIMFLPLTTL